MSSKFYVIETQYIGPNQDQSRYVDVDRVSICGSPATKNMSGDECTQGWCGTTNDWSVFAHGEFDTIADARAAITEVFGETRSTDANGDDFESDDADAIETYKAGLYEQMSKEFTSDWTHEIIQTDIKSDTTNERIAELVEQYESFANGEGYTLDSDIFDMMQRRREELRAEIEVAGAMAGHG